MASPDDWRPRRFYQRWRWIEWLFAATFIYLTIYSFQSEQAERQAFVSGIFAFVVYMIIAYFINLSERQCPACGTRARNNETRCNNCGNHLAHTDDKPWRI